MSRPSGVGFTKDGKRYGVSIGKDKDGFFALYRTQYPGHKIVNRLPSALRSPTMPVGPATD